MAAILKILITGRLILVYMLERPDVVRVGLRSLPRLYLPSFFLQRAAMLRVVLAIAFLSDRPSHTGIVSKRMNVGMMPSSQLGISQCTCI